MTGPGSRSRTEPRPAEQVPAADRGGGWAKGLSLALLAAALLGGATSAVSWFAHRSVDGAVQVGTSTFLSATVVALTAVQFVTDRRTNRGRNPAAHLPDRESESPHET